MEESFVASFKIEPSSDAATGTRLSRFGNPSPTIILHVSNPTDKTIFYVRSLFDIATTPGLLRVSTSDGTPIPFTTPRFGPRRRLPALSKIDQWTAFSAHGGISKTIQLGLFYPGIHELPEGTEVSVQLGKTVISGLDASGMEKLRGGDPSVLGGVENSLVFQLRSEVLSFTVPAVQ